MTRTNSNNNRNRKYEIILTEDQIVFLNMLLSDKNTSLTLRKRAMILLALRKNSGGKLTQLQLAKSLDMSKATISNTVRRFVTLGFDECMKYHRNPKQNNICKIQGEQEAHLIQLACSQAPAGHSNWSLELLRDKAVELKLIEPVSVETVRSVLKKTNFDLTKTNTGASLQNKTPTS